MGEGPHATPQNVFVDFGPNTCLSHGCGVAHTCLSHTLYIRKRILRKKCLKMSQPLTHSPLVDKDCIGYVLSPMPDNCPMTPCNSPSSHKSSPSLSPMQKVNSNGEWKLGTFTGKSSLYAEEKFQCDPFKNPFTEVDITNSLDRPVQKIIVGKKTQRSQVRASSTAKNLFDGTPSRIGIRFGNQPAQDNLWISQPRFE